MHRAATTTAISGIKPHDFRHQTIDGIIHVVGKIRLKNIEIGWCLCVYQLCEHLMMRTMRTIYLIVGTEH